MKYFELLFGIFAASLSIYKLVSKKPKCCTEEVPEKSATEITKEYAEKTEILQLAKAKKIKKPTKKPVKTSAKKKATTKRAAKKPTIN